MKPSRRGKAGLNPEIFDYVRKFAPPLIVAGTLVTWLLISFFLKRRREKSRFFENWPAFRITNLQLDLAKGTLNRIALQYPVERLEALGKPQEGDAFILSYPDYGMKAFLENGKIVSFSFELGRFRESSMPYRLLLQGEGGGIQVSASARYAEIVSSIGAPTSEQEDSAGREACYSDPRKPYETRLYFNSDDILENCDLDMK